MADKGDDETTDIRGVSLCACIRNTPSPFDKQNADVIIRSSDNVDFRVHKFLLAFASSVFEDMFSLPQSCPPDTVHAASCTDWKDGLPVVPVTENQETLDMLLRLCYPIRAPSVKTLDTVDALLVAAEKYDMREPMCILKGVLVSSRFLEAEPVGVYIIAYKHGFLDEARLATKHTLRLSFDQLLQPHPRLPVKNPSVDIRQPLLQYHCSCGQIAKSLVERLTSTRWKHTDALYWKLVFYRCRTCEVSSWKLYDKRPLPGSAPRVWWYNYMMQASVAVNARPWGSVVTDLLCYEEHLRKAAECGECRVSALKDLCKFSQLLAVEIDKEVSKVPFEMAG